MTYKEAYDKIIQAYFKDEIIILDRKFCFCGTLAGNDSWAFGNCSTNPYSLREFGKMERALFSTFPEIEVLEQGFTTGANSETIGNIEDFEEKLFAGICNALEVLKQIHKERGENVDEVQVFEKRKLKFFS